MKLCQFVASLYPHVLTNFGRFILILKEMALIFLEVLIIFTVSSFASQIALTSSLMMSGLNSLNLNPLDYEVQGQCWSLNTSCNRSQKQFPSLKCTLVNSACLTGESH